MRLLFFFFFLLIVASFTSAYVRKDNPFETANKIQAQLNSNVQSNNRWGVMSMMKNDFNYQDCNGRNYNSNQFADALMKSRESGKVETARADKDNIIYRALYGDKSREFMIQKTTNGYYYKNGQQTLC